LLALIFWLTISGANYPSQLLARGLFWIQDRLSDLFHALGSPPWLHDAVVLGLYRVPAWVVSVMLPPMAIFFPLFTLLEDAGYLPRVAYNLDKPFQCCKACGKQSLTMWVGNHRMRKKKTAFPRLSGKRCFVSQKFLYASAFLMNRTPRQFLPQWEEMVQPARVKKTSFALVMLLTISKHSV